MNRLRGIFAPVVTPFHSDLSPDPERFAAHCRWLLSQQCGLAIFGSNSEGNSLGVEERITLLEELLDRGIDPGRMMPGTGTCALTDTVRLTRRAVSLGCGGVLMLPPFYYKTVSDDGLFAYFSEVVQRVGDDRLRIYLYHIPPVAMVGITPALVERLLAAYPTQIAGMKDSSGNWDNTRTVLDAFGAQGFDVFCGSETFLLATLRQGGAGCISATANINPAAMVRLVETWQQPDADDQQAALDQLRQLMAAQPNMIAALKAVIARTKGDPGWARVRPPLTAMLASDVEGMGRALDALGVLV